MTDNEIIKALECCTTKGAKCSDCPAFKKVDRSDCKKYFRGAIDIINRQQAEIERLKECPKCIYEYDGKTTEYCIQAPCSNFKTVEQIKSEAYKEFAEKVKANKNKLFNYIFSSRGFDEQIDNLVKEYEKGRRGEMKVTKCKGEGQGSCKRCSDKGKWNRTWMCFLYKIEGYEGCYCADCVKEIQGLQDHPTEKGGKD